jgi:hypothetical protein
MTETDPWVQIPDIPDGAVLHEKRFILLLSVCGKKQSDMHVLGMQAFVGMYSPYDADYTAFRGFLTADSSKCRAQTPFLPSSTSQVRHRYFTGTSQVQHIQASDQLLTAGYLTSTVLKYWFPLQSSILEYQT